jgi:DNA-binding Lrp family transcriptional regulator
VIPDFVKLGYAIMAICHIKTKSVSVTELEEKAEKYWKKYPNVIFVSRAEGMGKNGVLISLHKSYSDHSNFLTENLREWGGEIQEYESTLIDLKGRIVKPLSLTYLGEQKET